MTLGYLGKAGGKEGLSHEAVQSKRFSGTATARAKAGRQTSATWSRSSKEPCACGAGCLCAGVGLGRGDRKKGAMRDHGRGGERQVVGNFLGYCRALAWLLSQTGATGETWSN